MEKRKEETIEEVNLTVQEYEDSIKKLEDSDGSEDPKVASTSGRRVFGMAKKAQIVDAGNKVKSDQFYDNSDSDDDLDVNKSGDIETQGSDLPQKDIIDDLIFNQEGFDTRKESVFKVMEFLFSWTFSALFCLLSITHIMHFLNLDHRTLTRL